MRIRIALAFVCAATLTACNGGTPSPAGWQAVPGASPGQQWSSGTGSALQLYIYEKKPFAGTLQELTSQQATEVVGRTKGSHFDGSDTYAPCPGQAALADFSAADRRTYVQGMSVRGGNAVLVTYVRPNGTPMNPEVAQAFATALCGSL